MSGAGRKRTREDAAAPMPLLKRVRRTKEVMEEAEEVEAAEPTVAAGAGEPREEALARALAWMDHEDASAADVEGPTEEERDAMRVSSHELLRLRQRAENTKNQTTPMAAQAKALRRQLFEWMVDNGKSMVAIPKATLDQTNLRFEAMGMPPVPAYIRLFRNNKDRAIQPSVVYEAVDSVTMDEVTEVMRDAKKPLSVLSAFLHAVCVRVRASVREYLEQVKLLTSLPKGMRAVEVEEAPANVVQWAIKMHTNEQGAKMLRAAGKAEDAHRLENLKRVEPIVDQYFARAGLVTDAGSASQRVVISDVPYRLVRRVAKQKQAIRFKVVEETVTQAIAKVWAEDEEEEEAFELQTVDQLQELLTERRTELAALVSKQLSELPPVTKTSIKLYDVPKPRTKAPEEDAQ